MHVIAGMLALLSGFVAMFANKGATWHRRAGQVFVGVMLIMAASGTVLAVLKPSWLSVLGGALTFYLVGTGWLTMRGNFQGYALLRTAFIAIGTLVALLGAFCGRQALAAPGGALQGVPPAGYWAFAALALLGTGLDARLLITARLADPHRTARHLWRMELAMGIATMSFFIGQMRVIPRPLRQMEWLILPVLLVVGHGLYWLIRTLRARRPTRRLSTPSDRIATERICP
jgi:uncharacterized membrane protein